MEQYAKPPSIALPKVGHNKEQEVKKDMTKLTAKDLEVLSHLLDGEQMACKKARIYSKTLTDMALSEQMGELADAHERRFHSLLTLLSGGSV
jgi:hypothetical protein